MKIIAHRGFWTKQEDKNTIASFIKAFDSGYGVETDIRDDRGKIVISHDMPTGSEIPFSNFLELLNGRNLPLAINIKSDGLINPLKELLQRYKVQDFFTFDMSFPESRKYIKHGLLPLVGINEFRPLFGALDEYAGIWLDSFEREWFDAESITRWSNLMQEKTICIVSPELHGRNHLLLWEMLLKSGIHKYKNIAICTDFPDQAQIFFKKGLL